MKCKNLTKNYITSFSPIYGIQLLYHLYLWVLQKCFRMSSFEMFRMSDIIFKTQDKSPQIFNLSIVNSSFLMFQVFFNYHLFLCERLHIEILCGDMMLVINIFVYFHLKISYFTFIPEEHFCWMYNYGFTVFSFSTWKMLYHLLLASWFLVRHLLPFKSLLSIDTVLFHWAAFKIILGGKGRGSL